MFFKFGPASQFSGYIVAMDDLARNNAALNERLPNKPNWKGLVFVNKKTGYVSPPAA